MSDVTTPLRTVQIYEKVLKKSTRILAFRFVVRSIAGQQIMAREAAMRQAGPALLAKRGPPQGFPLRFLGSPAWGTASMRSPKAVAEAEGRAPGPAGVREVQAWPPQRRNA